MKPNQQIRDLLKKHHIYLWQVGNVLQVSEQTIINWLRVEPLPEDHKKKIFYAITKIINERGPVPVIKDQEVL